MNLIISSPPYPMVVMWDEMFTKQDPSIEQMVKPQGDKFQAFNKMHEILNGVWKECDRILADGGFICINIGDAVRTFGSQFQMYSNHSKVIEFFVKLGYSVLPDII